MATSDWKLNLLAFPQRWDGVSGELHLRVAVLPRTNPLESLFPRTPPDPDEPAFVNASLSLNAMLIPSLERLPDPANVTAHRALAITPPADLEDVYQDLATLFPMHPPGTVTPKPEPRRKDTYIKKFLPGSYRRAFAFERPRTPFAYIDDTYHCALKTPPRKPPAPTPTGVSWGQVIAVVLQQPRLAERLGLVYADEITLPSNTFFEEGGWLYVALANTSDYASLAPPASDQVKYYAARLPPLKAGETRPLFAAVLFPVLSGPPPASYDETFLEAETYDDGFAKIVHADQPTKADVLDDSEDALPAVQDAGIGLGWDDEQLTIWMNRQIDPAFAAQDSPMAVLGYRVNVRKADTVDWTSLVRVQGQLQLGTLVDEPFLGEHSLRVAPVQIHSQRTGDYWLPSYFARWTGKSLVASDELEAQLRNNGASKPTWKGVDVDARPTQVRRHVSVSRSAVGHRRRRALRGREAAESGACSGCDPSVPALRSAQGREPGGASVATGPRQPTDHV